MIMNPISCTLRKYISCTHAVVYICEKRYLKSLQSIIYSMLDLESITVMWPFFSVSSAYGIWAWMHFEKRDTFWYDSEVDNRTLTVCQNMNSTDERLLDYDDWSSYRNDREDFILGRMLLQYLSWNLSPKTGRKTLTGVWGSSDKSEAWFLEHANHSWASDAKWLRRHRKTIGETIGKHHHFCDDASKGCCTQFWVFSTKKGSFFPWIDVSSCQRHTLPQFVIRVRMTQKRNTETVADTQDRDH